jgi:hypothetical protein
MERSKVLNTKVTFTIPLHVTDESGVFFTYTYGHEENLREFLIRKMKDEFDYPAWYYEVVVFDEIKKVSPVEIENWYGENL